MYFVKIGHFLFLLLVIWNNLTCVFSINNKFLLDRTLEIYIEKYDNIGNKGVLSGCCNERVNNACIPCQYYVALNLRKKYLFGLFNHEDEYIMKNYSKITEGDIEPFFYNTLIPFDYHEHDIIFYSIETHKIIDLWRYPLFKSQTIKLDNIYGINGIIRITGYTKVQHLTVTTKYIDRYFFKFIITVSSIYWKNYYDFNNKCCDETEEDICKNSCDYSFELIPNQNVQITRKAPLDKYDKQNSIFFSKNVFFQQTVFDLTIKIQKTDEEKTLLDEIQIVKIENEPNIQYVFNNLQGKYGNIFVNLSLYHQCANNIYKNCHTDCMPIYGQKYCGKDKDEIIHECINGAMNTQTCIDVPLKCNKNICKNDGLCHDSTGQIFCVCQPGYFGKFCEIWACDYSCHGKGICIGPNKCSCYEPYFGDECELFPCNISESMLCGENNTCVFTRGKLTCLCSEKNMVGEFCDEPFCSFSCNMGYCSYNPEEKNNKCLCVEGYIGKYCDKTDRDFKLTINRRKACLGIIIFIQLMLLTVIGVFSYTTWKKIYLIDQIYKKANNPK